MRFIHTGDLHLGKRVHEQSMLDEQREALAFITDTAKREKADALVIAGDVYDRSVPPVEAVELFDDFITELESAGIAVVAVPGNHDSAERVGYGGRILGKHGVYVSGEYDGTLARARIGCADFWLLPFVRPAVVAKATGKTCADFDECVRAALSGAEFSPGRRNVLVAHQFVTAAAFLRCARTRKRYPSAAWTTWTFRRSTRSITSLSGISTVRSPSEEVRSDMPVLRFTTRFPSARRRRVSRSWN